MTHDPNPLVERALRMAEQAPETSTPDGALPEGIAPLGSTSPSHSGTNWIDVVFDGQGAFLYITDRHGNHLSIGRWLIDGDRQRLRLPYPGLTPVEQLGPAAKHSHAADTERLAALRIEPKAGTLRARVLQEFVADYRQGGVGLTQDEVAERLGVQLYTAAPRCTELKNGGWLRDSTRRRDTPRGNPAIVWALTDRAVQHFQPD